jgi:hypothetical protein
MSFRRLSLVALLLVTTLGAADALADGQMSAAAVTVQIGNRTGDGLDIDLISTTDQPKMFNVANCECDTPRTVKVTIAGAAGYDGTVNVYYYIGPNCTDTTSRTSSCKQIAVHKLSDYFNQSVLEDITARQVISPVSPSCSPESGARSGANTFFVFIDWNGDQAFDETNDTIQKLELDYDVEPPAVVRNLEVTAGEQALNVSWTVPSDTDIESIQVLCARGTLPVFPEGTYKAGYQSAAGVCPTTGDGGVADGGEADGGVDDGGVQEDGGSVQQDAAATTVNDAGESVDAGTINGIPAASGLAALDPAYLCSNALGASTSGHRIGTLQNNVTYYVAVVAVDKSGNASPVWTMVPGSPLEVLDFWEDYKQQGGTATGCAFGPRVPVGWISMGLVGVGVALALVAARRRRGHRSGGGDR